MVLFTLIFLHMLSYDLWLSFRNGNQKALINYPSRHISKHTYVYIWIYTNSASTWTWTWTSNFFTKSQNKYFKNQIPSKKDTFESSRKHFFCIREISHSYGWTMVLQTPLEIALTELRFRSPSLKTSPKGPEAANKIPSRSHSSFSLPIKV